MEKKGWFTKFFRAKSHFLRGYSKYFDDFSNKKISSLKKVFANDIVLQTGW